MFPEREGGLGESVESGGRLRQTNTEDEEEEEEEAIVVEGNSLAAKIAAEDNGRGVLVVGMGCCVGENEKASIILQLA